MNNIPFYANYTSGIEVFGKAQVSTPSMNAIMAFFYIQMYGHFRRGKDFYSVRQGYRSYLLLYTLEGRGILKYREKNYILHKNDILLIDCYEYQEYGNYLSEEWEFVFIHFNGATSSEYYKLISEKYGSVITISENSMFCSWLLGFLESCSKYSLHTEAMNSMIILQILTHLFNGNSEKESPVYTDNTQRRVDFSIDYIHKNFINQISVKELASQVNYSLYHFIKIFKKATGNTPHEYILRCRINKAKELLVASFYSVEKIGNKVGFDDLSYFIHTFKKWEEITPLQYRKMFRATL